MGEGNGGGVQEISIQADAGTGFAADLARRTVKRVARHRMAQRRQMHANLVSAAGIDADLEQLDFSNIESMRWVT